MDLYWHLSKQWSLYIKALSHSPVLLWVADTLFRKSRGPKTNTCCGKMFNRRWAGLFLPLRIWQRQWHGEFFLSQPQKPVLPQSMMLPVSSCLRPYFFYWCSLSMTNCWQTRVSNALDDFWCFYWCKSIAASSVARKNICPELNHHSMRNTKFYFNTDWVVGSYYRQYRAELGDLQEGCKNQPWYAKFSIWGRHKHKDTYSAA